ncbi:hypothetical protein G3I15_17945, partial [Streptomyces sp. SID10244]|nr:hypothetical protein [Streptomyces sp. SID10244]
MQPEVETADQGQARPDTGETTPAETTPAVTEAPAAESPAPETPAADTAAADDESQASSATATPETSGMPSLFSSVEQTQHHPISAAEVAVSQPLFLSPQAVEPVKRAPRQTKAE